MKTINFNENVSAENWMSEIVKRLSHIKKAEERKNKIKE